MFHYVRNYEEDILFKLYSTCDGAIRHHLHIHPSRRGEPWGSCNSSYRLFSLFTAAKFYKVTTNIELVNVELLLLEEIPS